MTRNLNIVPAFVLMFSGCAKLIELIFFPHSHASPLDSRSLSLLVIEIEFSLGCWLLSNFQPKWSRICSIFLFSVFLIIAAVKISSNETTCGCFGFIKTDPWFSACVDALMILLLTNWRLTQDGMLRTRISTFTWIILSGALVVVSVKYVPARFENIGRSLPNSNNILLEPNKWIGRQLPITAFVTPNIRLSDAQKNVLIFDDQCHKCRELISSLDLPNPSIIFVNLSPVGKLDSETRFANNFVHLSPRYNWFGDVPILVRIVDGKVTNVVYGSSIKDFLQPP